jgi:hypothetical protein
LQVLDDARAQFLAHTAMTRVKAERSQAMLAERHAANVDPEPVVTAESGWPSTGPAIPPSWSGLPDGRRRPVPATARTGRGTAVGRAVQVGVTGPVQPLPSPVDPPRGTVRGTKWGQRDGVRCAW